jgi:hypothetical protein
LGCILDAFPGEGFGTAMFVFLVMLPLFIV